MTQDTALAILKTGANVFLTGEPGAGKTHTLNNFTEYLNDHGIEVAITASTGIAATHIGGMTIHSWSGIGIKETLSPYDLDQITSKERIVKRINKARVLVIDEISMLEAHTLMMVEQVVRTVKGLPIPFGGLQVVLVGDFFQLPPIVKRGDVAQFAFQAPVWHGMDPLVCYISEQYRQDEGALLSLLSALRSGDVDESYSELLESCKETQFKEGIEPTKLFTHNADVDRINIERLGTLEHESRKFVMEGKGTAQLIAGLKKSCISPEILELKIGAMVMCTKNNFEVGYVNGTLGQVIDFDADSGYPIIEALDGREFTVSPDSWRVTDGDKVLAEITQIPLRLAWAITVHKSQGMSLDAAEMDLSNAFEYGQGYVALSRVRSLEGLLLKGCNAQALMVHPLILKHDGSFKAQSEAAEEAFETMDEEELQKMQEKFITANGGSLEVDSSWKSQSPGARAKDKTSTYDTTKKLVLAGKLLHEIAEERGVKFNTIVDHIEKLLIDKKIAQHDIVHFKDGDEDKKVMFAELEALFKELGTEKLKPVYEAVEGRHSYDDIRLVRLFCIEH